MSNRTSRKRYRRRLDRQKTTAKAPLSWGWGDATPKIKGDMVLVRTAMANSWPTPGRVRRQLVAGMNDLLKRPDLSRRDIAAIVTTCVQGAVES